MPRAERGDLTLLFLTGLTSMGMEVVWVREFTPYLGTVVYAFAGILGVYLTATFIGSRIYRRWSSGPAIRCGKVPFCGRCWESPRCCRCCVESGYRDF